MEKATSSVVTYNTIAVVTARDSTKRVIAICAGDSAHTIGELVIAAIEGRDTFQLASVRDIVIGNDLSMAVERERFGDADRNPATAYELGRYDQMIAMSKR